MIANLKLKRLVLVLLVVSGILSALFGLWTHHQWDNQLQVTPTELARGFIFPEPKGIASFSLKRTDGAVWNNESLQNHYTLVFFGFTHCPQMCPTTLAALGQAYRLLGHDGHTVLPEMVFVTVDPERDTLSVMKRYLSGFHKAFLGATGTESDLKPLQESLGVLVMKPEAHDQMNGNIDHTGSIMVINPKGEFEAILSTPHEADILTHDIRKLVDRYYHPDKERETDA